MDTQKVDAKSAPHGILGWLRLWFLLRDPVGRWEYAVSGFGLMAFKYLVEFAVIGALTGLVYTPLDFVNPLISAREKFANGAPDWFGYLWVLWTLPFLWIAVGMSIRRALDLGTSPWNGLWVLVPFVNLPAMLAFACWPHNPEVATYTDLQTLEKRPYRPTEVSDTLKAAVGGIAVGALYALVLTIGSVYLFESYGAAIFFGTPLITGIASSYLLNLRRSHSYGASIGVAVAALTFGGIALMLFALEGAICIAMAAPIVLPLGIAGAPLGKFLADRRRPLREGLVAALFVLPVLAVAEAQFPSDSQFVVASHIDIAAPRDVVWRNVVDFTQITEQREWIFRLGVACPERARILGQGVGATRECIFTTGKFIEPITTWDEPGRLAFDVREQPSPMFELTPYRNIHPPHLDLSFRSLRGEFELAELPNGGTRLVGRTWYTLDILPHAYWTIWSDWLVHRIHLRVLRHIKQLAEAEAGGEVSASDAAEVSMR